MEPMCGLRSRSKRAGAYSSRFSEDLRQLLQSLHGLRQRLRQSPMGSTSMLRRCQSRLRSSSHAETIIQIGFYLRDGSTARKGSILYYAHLHRCVALRCSTSVSYTHLTLPTSDLV